MTDFTNNAARVLAVIPARGGSKRLPRKNVLNLGGKALIDWTVEAALESGVPSKIVVSSDDEEILEVGKRFPSITTLRRPDDLASDTATTPSVILHVLEQEEFLENQYDAVLLLQPTSPLRSTEDIQNTFQLFLEGNGETAVSICEVEHPIEWCGTLSNSRHFSCPLLEFDKRSQDCSKSYRLNGAVYVIDTHFFKSAKKLFTEQLIGSLMPQRRSVDVDNDIDLFLCEKLIYES